MRPIARPVVLATLLLPAIALAAGHWKPPRTSWGDPDLQGLWPVAHLMAVPLQRPEKYGDREQFTAAELAEQKKAVETQNQRYDDEDAQNRMGIGHWVELTELPSQTSLIVEPRNGRLPAQTEAGQQRSARMGSDWNREVFDSVKDFDVWNRCITRGLPASMFAFPYNNGIQILQAPGYVVINLEMIHEARIIPIGKAPALDGNVTQWMGSSRGRFEGDTLVVETTNFNGEASMTSYPTRGSPIDPRATSTQLKLTERFERTGPDSLTYTVTVDDPVTQTAPWTARMPWKRDDTYQFFEYACHEDNEAIRNYIVTSRARRAFAQALFSDSSAQFTLEQAERGKATYQRACLSCHGAALEGAQFGPALRGTAFESHWRGKSRSALAERIRTTMPPGGAGTLSSQGYTDVEAFILLANGGVPSAGEEPSATAPETQARPAAASIHKEEDNTVATMMSPVWRATDDPRYQSTVRARRTKLAALTPVTAATLANPPAEDWLMWRRTYDAMGFSPLRQINRSNVAKLRTAWSWQLPESGNEITPLVHDGVMFIYSGPVVQALDAATGDLLWQYLRKLPDDANNGRGSRPKSIAIYGERVFAATADGHLVALDARNGQLLWDRPIVPRDGRPAAARLQLNGGPIVAGGRVIIGVSLDVSTGGGCFIVGLDVETGNESWRFHTIARPGEPGGDTWNDAPLEQRFGGGVWTAGSYDPKLDLVYFGIANTYTSATLLEPRPGATKVTANDGLYTDATVALRPDTGKLAWHYQHHRRDVWDLDWVFEQTLVTLRIDGKPRKLVVTGGKTAIFDAVDAATGAFVFSRDLGVQNVITAIDPVTGEKTVNPAVWPEAGKAKLVCPGNFGARNWPATALNPDKKILYVPIMETCSDYVYAPGTPQQIAKGGVDMRYTARLAPGNDGRFGRITALDLQKREIVWTQRQRVPFSSSALATAGGLLFNGDLDRYFAAYDQRNGQPLWRTRLAAPAESTPVTYSANGRQFVAVVAGSGSVLSAAGRGLVPEVAAPVPGTSVVVFELP